MDIEKIKQMLLSNHNLILTGAPGTGKTYIAKEVAKAMRARYKIVQFHPSYDYTDFVEGLRPIKDGNSLGFQRTDGVFKKFCKEAAAYSASNDFMSIYQEIVEKVKNNTYQTYDTKRVNDRTLSLKKVKGIEQIVFRVDNDSYKTESIENAKKMFDQLINDGIYDIKSYKKDDLFDLVKKATDGATKTIDIAEYRWLLQKMLETYKTREERLFVFIIDEINRGEISKIFGELFYSIDSGYRGKKGMICTQYQNLIQKNDVFYDGFYIPENVYIIGTMNDIDRSVESMDFAMRRRFAWKEITVESRQNMLDEVDAWGNNGKPTQKVIEEIKIRMNNLNAAIIDKYNSDNLSQKEKIGLNKAYQIGAAYFLKYNLYNDFEALWENHLEGISQRNSKHRIED